MKVRPTPEDRKLIAEVVQIVRATVTAGDDELPALRRQAHTVLARLRQQQRLFAASHGITAANPTSRAWYLFQTMTEHASLLA